jgi:hypothetical protein
MTGIRPSSMTLATLLLLASIPVTVAQVGGGGGAGGGSGVGGGGAAGSTTSPGGSSIGAPTGSPGLPLPSSRPSAATNPSANDGRGRSLSAPIPPPDSAGSTGGPDTTGSTNAGQGSGNETGLGNIGPETEREQRAQEESDRATKGICEDC